MIRHNYDKELGLLTNRMRICGKLSPIGIAEHNVSVNINSNIHIVSHLSCEYILYILPTYYQLIPVTSHVYVCFSSMI